LNIVYIYIYEYLLSYYYLMPYKLFVLVSISNRNINISIKRLKANSERKKNIKQNSYCPENNRNNEGTIYDIYIVLSKCNKYVLNMIHNNFNYIILVIIWVISK